ncbi:hypothetical protein NDU88_000682 [Pleurodeles waltl]|uniref:Uncharacterized protein n=1 Tax=Pleurodeles waltl TaxID=8319 RepID=A0AAV7VY78_PLEWA|nr:hypothetical protein NDU88_000682 [Pleurodeles waltl]
MRCPRWPENRGPAAIVTRATRVAASSLGRSQGVFSFRQPSDHLSPPASGTSAPGASGWEGGDGPAAGDPAPRVEAASPPQTAGAHASARDVGSYCAGHGASDLGGPPQRAGGVASAQTGRSGHHVSPWANRAATGAWGTPLAAKPLSSVRSGQGVRGDNQRRTTRMKDRDFFRRMTEGSRALSKCDRHLDARSHAPQA